MRSFSLPFLTLCLFLGSIAQAELSPRSQAIKFGRSENSFVEARDVEAALEVLRRANYNLEDHLFKRSGTYSYKSKGDVCYCKPDPHHHSSHHHHSTSTKKSSSKPTSPGNHEPSPPGNHKPSPTSSYHHSKPTHHEPHGGDHHHNHWSSSKTPCTTSTSAHSPGPTDKPSCPSGYKSANKGDTFIYNDNDLIDASNLTLLIDILNYSSAGSSPVQTSQPAKDHPKCEDEWCCYKEGSGSGSSGGSSGGSTGGDKGVTCQSGYQKFSKGDTIIKDDNDLIDLSDLTITLNILSYSSPTASPVSTTESPTNGATCESDTCCVKQSTMQGSTVIQNDNDVVDASGATVKACILSICT